MKDEKNRFQTKAYGFQELARMYFPCVAPATASAMLKRWIRRAPRLMAQLSEAGYVGGQRVLTPKQVRLIVEHLDPP